MWSTLAGAGTLVERNRQILMVYHFRSGKYRWELPSGIIAPGESLEQVALRETKEETGIDVEIGALFCTVVMDVPLEEYRGINLYYCAQALTDQIQTPNDYEPITDVAFKDIDTLKARDVHPVDWRILSRWKRGSTNKPFYFRMVF